MGSQGLTNWGIRRGREKERGIRMRGRGEFLKKEGRAKKERSITYAPITLK
ncbi:unnamed protein product [Penicillium camemberti]|uniref:Str. FM013 n=1 Tax=Penicillium camemberti (strain FM 013) TaxID=1429867 RepID=A0A0G4NSN0_PENC3|nr:unnamed protein product [Penicillium camemberti]